ncbi:MAG: hypothetical protein E7050_00675 [Lentisphaerae bacterium]|nr:hypothetical protein [Lentisphaerota bacterium]
MTFPPEIMQLAAMLDDRDEEVAVNIMAQLLAHEDELGELPALLQENPDPLVRRRAHLLQNAIAMRYRRRGFFAALNETELDGGGFFSALTALHLLWYDKDQSDEVAEEVVNFLHTAEKFVFDSLEDVELFMRKNLFLPENETTIRPEIFCIGTVLYQHCGATSLLMGVNHALLADEERFRIVRVNGRFGLLDTEKKELLSGNGAWTLTEFDGKAEFWTRQDLLRYLAVTLLSCAVNSDSYRYVMSITQALTGDESEHVFDSFPYPFCSGAIEGETEK